MPTKHPRVQVSVDPELAGALRRASPHLNARSEAARIRELALRGAEQIDAFDHARYAAAIDGLLAEELPGLDEIVAARHAEDR